MKFGLLMHILKCLLCLKLNKVSMMTKLIWHQSFSC